MFYFPKVSVIIPVYNVEKYLDQCLTSVINQDYKNIEVILVDDGSTDNSPTICDEYAQNDDRTRVIHKENGGASTSRNVGIHNITGDYVLFVDSDDYIAANAVSKIMEMVNHYGAADLVFLEACKFYDDNKKLIPMADGYVAERINGKTKEDIFLHLQEIKKYPASPCTKLINANLFKANSLYFIEGTTSEDIEWVARLLSKAKTILYYGGNYYYYRQNRAGSVTNTYSEKKFKDLLCMIEAVVRYAKDGEYKDTLYSFMAYEYPILLVHYANLHDKHKYKEQTKSLSYLLGYKKDKRTRIINICYKMLGIETTSKMLSFYLKVRGK